MSPVSNSIRTSHPGAAMPSEPTTVNGYFAGYSITPQRASAQRFLEHFCPTIGIANGGEPPSEPPQ